MTRVLGRLRSIARIAGPERVDQIDDFMRRRPRRARALIEGDDPLRVSESLAVLMSDLEVEPEDHTRRLIKGMSAFTRAVGSTERERYHAVLGVLCHDIGKLSVPDTILQSPVPLNSAELDAIHMHSSLGYSVLFGLEGMAEAAQLVFHHHEYWDGTGYHRIGGTAIPLLARMFSIVDSYDSILRDDRPYRVGGEHASAVEELVALGGEKYDPDLIVVFAELVSAGWLESAVSEASSPISA